MRYIMVVLFSIVLTSVGYAQENPDLVKHRNECRLAEQIMTTGHPEPHRQWARGYIAFCGGESWGRAAAAAVLRSRMSPDRSSLQAEWARVHLLRDSTLFAAALNVAGDVTASVPARVLAIRYLLGLIEPNRVITYQLMVEELDARGRRRGPCFERLAAGRQAEYRGVPLPAGHRERVVALLRQISSHPAQPAPVRSAALCL